MYVTLEENNPILSNYLNNFIKLQKKRLSELSFIDKKIVNKLSDNFFLFPDVNVLINYLYNNEKGSKFLPEKESFYQSKLKEFINYYLEDSNYFYKLRGNKIKNTTISLTLEDYNPYSSYDAHPEHNQIVGTLGEKKFDEWKKVYDNTFDIFFNLNKGLIWELNKMIKKIVPMGTAENIHNSASYKECFGTLYLGYTIGNSTPEINNIEAIIHESSHNKLNLISYFDKLVLNDYNLTFYSPYRPDARHIRGVFLGIHAFTPTIYYLLSAYLNGLVKGNFLLEKIYLYHLKNKYAFYVLKKYGQFTELGDKILLEVKELIKKTDELLKGNIEDGLKNRVKYKFKEHLQEVIKNYPYLKY